MCALTAQPQALPRWLPASGPAQHPGSGCPGCAMPRTSQGVQSGVCCSAAPQSWPPGRCSNAAANAPPRPMRQRDMPSRQPPPSVACTPLHPHWREAPAGMCMRSIGLSAAQMSTIKHISSSFRCKQRLQTPATLAVQVASESSREAVGCAPFWRRPPIARPACEPLLRRRL